MARGTSVIEGGTPKKIVEEEFSGYLGLTPGFEGGGPAIPRIKKPPAAATGDRFGPEQNISMIGGLGGMPGAEFLEGPATTGTPKEIVEKELGPVISPIKAVSGETVARKPASPTFSRITTTGDVSPIPEVAAPEVGKVGRVGRFIDPSHGIGPGEGSQFGDVIAPKEYSDLQKQKEHIMNSFEYRSPKSSRVAARMNKILTDIAQRQTQIRGGIEQSLAKAYGERTKRQAQIPDRFKKALKGIGGAPVSPGVQQAFGKIAGGYLQQIQSGDFDAKSLPNMLEFIEQYGGGISSEQLEGIGESPIGKRTPSPKEATTARKTTSENLKLAQDELAELNEALPGSTEEETLIEKQKNQLKADIAGYRGELRGKTGKSEPAGKGGPRTDKTSIQDKATAMLERGESKGDVEAAIRAGGLNPEDFNLTVGGGTLTIEGESPITIGVGEEVPAEARGRLTGGFGREVPPEEIASPVRTETPISPIEGETEEEKLIRIMRRTS